MKEPFTMQEVSTIESRDVFGLTGGMGSGKSTVSSLLAESGVVIVDADKIVHDLQQPGQPVLLGMTEILGEDILYDDGSLNRSTAAQKLFHDATLRAHIGSMMGPHIKQHMFNQIKDTAVDDLVILDVPLLLESEWHRLPLKGVLVVNTPRDIAIARLVQHRGFTADEADARLATQMSQERRLGYADFVINNSASEAKLAEEVDRARQWMETVRKLGASAVMAEQP